MNQNNKTIIAAVGDIHFRESDQGKWMNHFKGISEQADILLLCGDLTDTGKITEAEALAEELKFCSIPVICVLGNHDYERNQQKEIKHIIEKENIYVLDGESVIVKNIGFAGVKGFCGGFDKYTLARFGESMIKQFVEETVEDTLKLDRALVRLNSQYAGLKKVVILHYSPTKETLFGEPEEIFPFLGSSRLAEPIDTRQVTAVFHGHAHLGKLQGNTPGKTKVFNVSKAILQKSGFELPFYILEI